MSISALHSVLLLCQMPEVCMSQPLQLQGSNLQETEHELQGAVLHRVPGCSLCTNTASTRSASDHNRPPPNPKVPPEAFYQMNSVSFTCLKPV